MTLDTVGGRHNLPEVILGDEREELETETEASFDPVRGRFFFRRFFFFFHFSRRKRTRMLLTDATSVFFFCSMCLSHPGVTIGAWVQGRVEGGKQAETP